MSFLVNSFPFIQQLSAMECGTTSLAIILKHYGYANIRGFLKDYAEVSTEGVDLFGRRIIAKSLGFETQGYELELDTLQDIQLPCIAHVNSNHFVVVYRLSKKKVHISDPAKGKYQLSKEKFESIWNGIVLELLPKSLNKDLPEMVDSLKDGKTRKRNFLKSFYLISFVRLKKLLLQIFAYTVVLQVLGLVLPLLTKTIIDEVLVNENEQLLYAVLVGVSLVFISQILLTYGANLLLIQFKISFERDFFSRFFYHFIHLKQSYFDLNKREDFTNRFQENLKIRQALRPRVLRGIIDTSFVFLYVLVLFFYNSELALMVLAYVIVYILCASYFSPKLKNIQNIIFKENIKTVGEFLDVLLGIQSVKLLGIEKLKFWAWRNQYTRTLNEIGKSEIKHMTFTTVFHAIYLLAQTLVYWFGAYLTFQAQLSIGEYVAFIAIFSIIANSLNSSVSLWFTLTELTVSYDRINDVLAQETIIENKTLDKHLKGPVDIRLKNLSFKYLQRDEKNILEDISVEIRHGEFVGIVGRNGSGKTTLAKLLCQLYTDYNGSIQLNGMELKSLNPFQTSNLVHMLPQDLYLFDDTIKENIRYGNPKATNEEVIEAAKLADIHEFVVDQYLGYNLRVGLNGRNLSGGQKLKIGFARLFVSNPDIIILDEASSALDLGAEAKIMNNLLRKFEGKTIITIAHRIHTIKKADKILVLDKGRLEACGRHEMLIDQNETYQKFVTNYIQF